MMTRKKKYEIDKKSGGRNPVAERWAESKPEYNHQMMRHDSFKERVNHLENDHRESGQGGGLPMVLEPGTATLSPVLEIQG